MVYGPDMLFRRGDGTGADGAIREGRRVFRARFIVCLRGSTPHLGTKSAINC